MNTCLFHTPFNTGDPISARTARRAAAHPRPVESTDLAMTLAAADDAGSRNGPAPAPVAQILRRWSVAELIASATWPQELA
jgi:hypothetical protein